MANMVRVYNDNVVDHKESYKGEDINIPAGGFIVMDRDEAVQFKSKFFPPKFDKGGQQEITSMKRIRLAAIPKEEQKDSAKPAPEDAEEHRCMACGFTAKSGAGLKSHIRSNHGEIMVDDDAKKELMANG
jgi:hypothetical protein